MNSSTTMVLSLVFLIVTFLFLVIGWGFYRMGMTIGEKSKEADDALRNKEEMEREFLASNVELQEHALNFTSMELHDNIGQVISIVRTKLTMVMDGTLAQSQKDTIIEEAFHRQGKVLKDIRNIARSVNIGLLEELGLVEAIRKQLSFVKDLFHVECRLEYDDTNPFPNMDNRQNIFLFRIVQEAIHNVLVHAKATRMLVTVTVVDRHIQITVKDNGTGFDIHKKQDGMGLRSMRYRANLLGANLEIISVTCSGTTVSITM